MTGPDIERSTPSGDGGRALLQDPVTGLPNSLHARVHLDAAWGAAARGGELALVLFRTDDLEGLRTRLGPDAADGAVRTVGAVLAHRTRPGDLSARLSETEFLTILAGCDAVRAEAFALDIQARIQTAALDRPLPLLRAGVAAATEATEGPDALLAAAREAADRGAPASATCGRPGTPGQVAGPDAPPESGGAGRPADHPSPAAPLQGRSVLVVDDDPGMLTAARRLLERLGANVRTSESPREALATVKADAALDLLITDIVMGEMNGFTMAELAMRVRPELPVLYISGYAQDEVYWGASPGVRSHFLQKPLSLAQLRAALGGLLRDERDPVPGVASLTTPSRGAPEGAGPQGPSTLRAEDPATTPLGSSPAEQRRGRILVVDDDAAVVKSLQRLFRRAGYQEPVGLSDPTRTVDVLRTGGFDLLILDLHMPDLDGFGVLAALKEVRAPEEYFPVLVLTGDDDPVLRGKALEAGAMDFLNKPFDPTEAEARARNLLATRFLTMRVLGQRDTLEARVAARTAELADTRAEVLHRLARAAEYRDDVTGRHADRVGMLSSHLATELGMALADVDLIRRTAPLHDIGKIGVPDAILNKPGRLSDAEYLLIQSHTTIGAEILGGSSHRILQIASNIALSHHENWDGTGYPHGSAGEEIPLEARIVSVADTFDVISHRRPYKEALPPQAALDELRRCSGSQFDPRVVEAFEAITARVGLEGLHRVVDPLDPSRDTNVPDRDDPDLRSLPRRTA